MGNRKIRLIVLMVIVIVLGFAIIYMLGPRIESDEDGRWKISFGDMGGIMVHHHPPPLHQEEPERSVDKGKISKKIDKDIVVTKEEKSEKKASQPSGTSRSTNDEETRPESIAMSSRAGNISTSGAPLKLQSANNPVSGEMSKIIFNCNYAPAKIFEKGKPEPIYIAGKTKKQDDLKVENKGRRFVLKRENGDYEFIFMADNGHKIPSELTVTERCAEQTAEIQFPASTIAFKFNVPPDKVKENGKIIYRKGRKIESGNIEVREGGKNLWITRVEGVYSYLFLREGFYSVGERVTFRSDRSVTGKFHRIDTSNMNDDIGGDKHVNVVPKMNIELKPQPHSAVIAMNNPPDHYQTFYFPPHSPAPLLESVSEVTSSEQYFNKGKKSMKKGEFKTAVLQFRKAKAMGKNDRELYTNLAIAERRTHNSLNAIKAYETLKSKFSDNDIKVSKALAGLYFETTKYEKALKQYKEVERQESSPTSRIMIAQCYEMIFLKRGDQSMLEKAVNIYTELMKNSAAGNLRETAKVRKTNLNRKEKNKPELFRLEEK